MRETQGGPGSDVRVDQLVGNAANQGECQSGTMEPMWNELQDEVAKTQRMVLGATTERPRVGEGGERHTAVAKLVRSIDPGQ